MSETVREAVHADVEQAVIVIDRARTTYLNTLRGVAKQMQGLVDRDQIEPGHLQGLVYTTSVHPADVPWPTRKADHVTAPAPHEDPPIVARPTEMGAADEGEQHDVDAPDVDSDHPKAKARTGKGKH
jgi:hypothetical protein